MSYRRTPSVGRPSSLYSSSPGFTGLSGLGGISSYSSSGYGSSLSQSSPYLNGLSSSPTSYTSYGGTSSGYGSLHLPSVSSTSLAPMSPAVFSSLLNASLGGKSSRSSSPSTYRPGSSYSISPTIRSPSSSRYPSRSSSFNRQLTRPSRKSDHVLSASTRSLASSEGYESGGEQSEASSRLNSVSVEDESNRQQPTTENGEIDYKKLWEESQAENAVLREKLRCTENELSDARRSERGSSHARSGMSDAEKREKRAMERKLSEMEEELKQLQKLKADNERLRAENRALTRVVSKLTSSHTK